MHIDHWWEGQKERDRPLGRERRKWVDNIKLDLSKIVWCDVDWIDLAQDRDQWSALLNAVMNFRVPIRFLILGWCILLRMYYNKNDNCYPCSQLGVSLLYI
jgi:hypothetical protein